MEFNAPGKNSSLLDQFDSSIEAQASSVTGTSGLVCEPRATLEAARAVQSSRMMHLDDLSDDEAVPLALSSPKGRRPATGGFRLNYDFETPLSAVDVGGADQQQRMADFVTRSIDNLCHGLSVRKAREQLGLANERDLLPGLEVRLLGHQAIGVAWMVAQEKGPHKGGILADDMGLGKTVQMIATMTAHMPQPNDEYKTNLVVVPAALLQQWKEEIETKSNNVFSVHIHHGKDKIKKLSQLAKYDVIITSYQTLNTDFHIPPDIESWEEAEWLSKHGGVLAQAKFYRAIADEAQFIRNRSTRSSLSLAHVKAKYRWMLTGTPVTNTLADIYGLLRFGRFRPFNDWNDFNQYVAKVQIEDAPLAGTRAQAILKPLMLRRTKDAEIDGRPILDLPPKEIELVELKFTEEERHIYDSFEKQTKIRLNRFIRERTLIKNHAAVLVMILRLRQLCCHPNLILSQTEDYEDPTSIVKGNNEKELARARKAMGSAWVAMIKERFLARARATELLDFSDETDTPDPYCPVCNDFLMRDNGRVLSCGHEICFDCILDLKNSPVGHNGIFGEGTEKENLEAEKAYETAAAKGHRPCPTCKKLLDLSAEKSFKWEAFEPTDEELTRLVKSKRQERRRKVSSRMSDGETDEVPSPRGVIELDDSDDDLPDVSSMLEKRPNKRRKKSEEDDELDPTQSRTTTPATSDVETEVLQPGSSQGSFKSLKSGGRGRKVNRKASGGSKQGPPSDRQMEAMYDIWRRGDDDLEPSTKMTAMMSLLREWEATGDKVICYSQWTSMLDLVDIMFSRHGILSLRFDGKMDKASRDETLSAFRSPLGPKVMLISTKCGSVGLNLVSANRIINLDLSWNYAAESQAYDRCHRIGQEKPVYVKRLVVKDTIEERMLKLQDVKMGLAEAALGEGSGVKLQKLSVRDIKYLFGMTKRDVAIPENQRTLPSVADQQ